MRTGGKGVTHRQAPDEAEAALTAILRSKLITPALDPDTLPRAGLVGELTKAATSGRLTKVVAGAGWGKSTLLTLWAMAQADPARVAWLSIDTDDNDPTRFWAHALAGLMPMVGGLGDSLSQLLSAPATSTVEDLVPKVSQLLAAQAQPLSLVLDDYHLIDEPEVQRGVAMLARRPPATLRLVISSRRDELPGVPNVRPDIGPAQLRFSTAEASELLVRERGSMTADDIEFVYDRTEGWAAGLRHAAANLRARTCGREPAGANRGGERVGRGAWRRRRHRRLPAQAGARSAAR